MIIYLCYLPASSIITPNIPRSAGTWHSCHPRQDLTQKYTNIHFQFHLLFSHLPHSCKCLYSPHTKVATQPRSQVLLIVRTYALLWSLKNMVILHFQGNCRWIVTLAAFYCRKMETTLRQSTYFSPSTSIRHMFHFRWWFSNFWVHQILLNDTDCWNTSPEFLIW